MWTIILGFISQVLLTLNSSSNLMVYCMVVARMRITLCRMVTCRSRIASCHCINGSESSQCPTCGRHVMGLKTLQRSEREQDGVQRIHAKRNSTTKSTIITNKCPSSSSQVNVILKTNISDGIYSHSV